MGGALHKYRVHLWRRDALGALLLAPLLAATSAVAEPAGQQERARGLTIAVLDLAGIPALAPPPQPTAQRPAWRTTFGSERETPPEVKARTAAPIAALAGTDAVLIQGVRAAAPLRRLFPPSAWRLIVSRRVLSLSDPVGFRTVRSDLPPSTAIAVRAHQDLRVTARTFTLRLEPPQAGTPLADTEATATAVRLVDQRGRTLWLASVALPAACSAGDPPCPALETLDAWRQEKLKSGEPTVIGGRMTFRAAAEAERETEKAGEAPVACTSPAIESDLAWHRLPPAKESDSSGLATSCIAIVRIAD